MGRNYKYWLLFLSVTVFSGREVSGQLKDSSNRVEVILSDKTPVKLFKAEPNNASDHTWHYLPVNLRISAKAGNPEFSFLSYDTDDDGEVDGAIMHLLITWGLTLQQSEEAEKYLRKNRDSLVYITGSIPLRSSGQDNSFTITGKNPLVEVLIKSLKSRGSAPLSPGEKIALSFMFSAQDARQMETALKDTEKLKGIYFELVFDMYRTDLPSPIVLRGDFQQWMAGLGEKQKIK